MRLITEDTKELQKALFVLHDPTPLSTALENHIAQRGVEVTRKHSLKIKDNLSEYSYVFIFVDKPLEKNLFYALRDTGTKVAVITFAKQDFDKFERLNKTKKFAHIRVINADPNNNAEDVVERILWFVLSNSKEPSLNTERTIKVTADTTPSFSGEPKLTRRRMLTIIAGIALFVHLFFIFPLIGSTYYLYKAGTALQDQKLGEAQQYSQRGRPFLSLSKTSFAISRPMLLFLFVGLIPENIISIEENGYEFIDTTIDASLNARQISALILKPNKNPDDIEEARRRVDELNMQVQTLSTSSRNMKDKINYSHPYLQDIKMKLDTIYSYLDTTSALTQHLGTILGDTQERNYIVFFYNNMEIRPGGGFIGSFAHVVFENYTLKDFKVYDVYDADGQLKAHVEPPKAIRNYLGEVHWFLRDSNFSPNFEENFKTAQFFLDRSLELRDFDGGIAITTTALTYALQAFGDTYIPDFDETINADNFYIKAQTHTEQDFFPGSKQKKSYLSTIGRSLLLKIEQASPALLGIGVKKALDEKHIVMVFDMPEVQADIDRFGWSGKVVYPQCAANVDHCVINHILPVDANLGVNKANYFVRRFVHLATKIDSTGTIDNVVTTTFENTSPSEEFPGGTYKNYFQMYLPSSAVIKAVEHNGIKVKQYDVTKTGFFKIVGTYIEVAPQKSSDISILYTLGDRARVGENAYQIVIQKQIGAFSNDFNFEVDFPDNMYITDQNFTSLAKNNIVGYNSSLSTDKIFVIKFIKE